MFKFRIYSIIALAAILLTACAVVVTGYLRDIDAAREELNRAGSQLIETDCGPIEYARSGQGPAVLVVHGSMGGFDAGLQLAEMLEPKYEVISVSRFGYLRSPMPENPSVNKQAEVFACLLDALEVEKAAVLAVSGGANSAIRFAARYPERTSALILVSPAAPGKVEAPTPPRMVFDVFLRSDFVYWGILKAARPFMQNMIGVPGSFTLTPETEAEVNATLAKTLPSSRRMDGMIFDMYLSTPEFYEEISDASPYPLKKMETPVLIFNARDDPLAIPENVRGLAEMIPAARLVVLPDGGHLLLGHDREIRSEIARFLDDHTAVRPVQARRDAVEPSKDPTYEEIDAYIEKRLNELNIPGASLVIVEGDQIVHTKGFGLTGPGGAEPTAQTPFFIGSLTKSFTALAVMQLVEAGQVELDAPVQRYLPWFRLADPHAAAEITVRHLLNQTGGLTQIPGMIAIANFDQLPDAAEKQARALASFELSRPVGSLWEYSNLNYSLLGLVIEAASDESYSSYIQNHIFAPLEMHHSYTSKSAAHEDGLATGHMQWFGFPVPVPDLPTANGSLAGGYLMASAEDLGHYLIAQLNEGGYGGQRVISAQSITEMHRPAAAIEVAGNDMGDYGMGWFVTEIRGEPLIFHDGEVPDFFAYMAILPERKRAMALLINTLEQGYNYAMWTTAENSALMLAGLPPQSDAWPVLPWALRAALLLPVFQIAGIFGTVKKVNGWRQDPSRRPGRTRLWLLHILLPALPDLLFIAAAGIMIASGMLKFLLLFMGDVISVLLLCGLIGVVRIIIRSCMVLQPSQPQKERILSSF